MRQLSPRVAETHRPEYRIHKYWARKPGDVLSHHLASLLPEPGLVVDPFCGSGVLLKEAASLGHQVIGADVNPIAVSLSRFTLSPPPLEEYLRATEEVLEKVSAIVGDTYSTKDSNTQIRYAVHAIVVRCPTCAYEVDSRTAARIGKIYSCPNCAGRVRLNRKAMVRTEVIEVVTTAGSTRDPSELEYQAQMSNTALPGTDSSRYDFQFVVNNRTLAYEGMTTSHLFTERNMSVLAVLADEISSIAEDSIRRAVELTLTSGLASSSRLIAYRDGMKGGGPAWSVPGFWVPPIHLESNPLNHFRARVKAFTRALVALDERPTVSHLNGSCVHLEDAITTLNRVAEAGRADLVFLDPPYGDSVPYLEFSTIWNSFLGDAPAVSQDISVSNREVDNGGWRHYELRLLEILNAVDGALAPHGKILLTFNNNDRRAWMALVSALQLSGFGCADLTYQMPAVVPAKAQFSPKGSYLGDLYSVFERGERTQVPIALAKELVHKSLLKCASARHGVLARNLVARTIMIELLRANVLADEMPISDSWVAEWFEIDHESLKWKGELDPLVESIDKLIARETDRLLDDSDSVSWSTLAAHLVVTLEDYGAPDAVELKSIVAHYFDFKKNVISRRAETADTLF